MNPRMELREAEILERCLCRLEQGADLEQCLQEVPEAAALRPLLEAALWIRQGQEIALRPQALRRMIQEGQRYAARILRARPSVSPRAFRWAGVLVALLGLILVVLGVAGTAEASLPGEPLYPVKRAVERLVAIAMPPEERALWLAERRWAEFEWAAAQGRWLPAVAEESLAQLAEAARFEEGKPSPRRARLLALYARQGVILQQALEAAPTAARSELVQAQRAWARLARALGLPEGSEGPPSEGETVPVTPEPTAEILRERTRTPPGLERRETPRPEQTPPGLERQRTPRSERTPPGLERQQTPQLPRTPPGQQDQDRGPKQVPPGRP